MPELLLEVGCEELPASFVERAYNDLKEGIVSRLQEGGVLEGDSQSVCMGTPRRLIVSVSGVLARQPDSEKQVRGPALSAAFGANGAPTPALLGFCRSAGVDVAEITKDDKYVWANKKSAGVDTRDLLQTVLPDAIRGLSFDKSMRWGTGKMRFARPIRWILAAFDGVVVPFKVESVASGLTSKGHRFYANQPFTSTNLSEHLANLRTHKVEPEVGKRRERILAESLKASGKPDLPDALVYENSFLTEMPDAVHGQFHSEYLNLPEPVLVTAMAKHEKMFPVRNDKGELTNNFVFIRNGGQDSEVRKGCEWVLNARFNDARFFFNSDKQLTLEDFLAKTQQIAFGKDLGTVHQRAGRLAKLSASIAKFGGLGESEIKLAEEAGRLAKADLSTGLVSELPSLQGLIGSEYAKREGKPSEVVAALASQYDFSRVKDTDSKVSLCLLAADQIDKLAGYLTLGLEPTGSSDPYGLRRAATFLIESAWKWTGLRGNLLPFFAEAVQGYIADGIFGSDKQVSKEALTRLLSSRYDALLDFPADVKAGAAQGDWIFNPRAVRFRCECLTAAAGDTALVQAATRVTNLVVSAQAKKLEFAENPNTTNLDSKEGLELFKAAIDVSGACQQASSSEDVSALLGGLGKLIGPINVFFDNTMIMVDDARVRATRLALLGLVHKSFDLAGDFSKLA